MLEDVLNVGIVEIQNAVNMLLHKIKRRGYVHKTPIENPIEMIENQAQQSTQQQPPGTATYTTTSNNRWFEVNQQSSLNYMREAEMRAYFELMRERQRGFMFGSDLSISPDLEISTLTSEDFVLPDPKSNEVKMECEVLNRSRAYGDSRKFYYKIGNEPVMAVEQIPFPNCCGVAILHNFSVDLNSTQEMMNDFLDYTVSELKANDQFSKILIYTAENNGRKMKLVENYPNAEIGEKFVNFRTKNLLTTIEINIER
jgi:hypothetical protein